MFSKINQFAPDADTTEQNIWTDVANVIPTTKSYKTAPAPYSVGTDALASAAISAVTVRKLDNSTKIFAGTATKLYELNSTAWTDRSSTTYSASNDIIWSFAQFGDVTLAVNKGDYLQQYTSGTAFATVTLAPKAALVETVNQFVFVANTNDSGFGDSPDRWWCSAVGDHEDWTPNTSTQCVTGRLTSSSGRINALKRLGDNIVAYKDRAIYVGAYVGAPEAWNFQEIPGQVGCIAAGAVIDVGAAHIFIGMDDFYHFDGSRPVPIGNAIKEWFFADLYADYGYRIKSSHDKKNSCVYFHYPSNTGLGAIDSAVVYNYKVNKWGRADRSIECPLEYIAAGLTFAGSYATGTTYAAADISFDSQVLVAGTPTVAYIGTDHKVYTLTGTGGSWSFTTGDLGDDTNVSTVTRVKPRFVISPTTASMDNFYRMEIGDSLQLDKTTSFSDGKFDVIRSSRWHRFVVSGTGHMEITGMDIQGIPEGHE